MKGTFCPGESTVHIYDAAFSSYRQRTILLKIGEWTRESGLHLFERASDVNSRLRLQDISFRVATFQVTEMLCPLLVTL